MFILLIKLGLAIKKLEKDEIYLNWRKTHQKSSKWVIGKAMYIIEGPNFANIFETLYNNIICVNPLHLTLILKGK